MIKDISLVTPGRLYLLFRARGDEPYQVASGLSEVLSDVHDHNWSVHKFHFKYNLLDRGNPDYDGDDALEEFYERVRFTPEVPARLLLQPLTNGEREVSLDLSTKLVEHNPYEKPLMALEITPETGFDRTCFFNGRVTTSRTYADALKIMSEIKKVVHSRRAHVN